MNTENPGSNFNVKIGMIDMELENECQNQASILVKTIIDEILSAIPIQNSENKDIEVFGIKIFYFVREVMICYLLTADQSQARTGAC